VADETTPHKLPYKQLERWLVFTGVIILLLCLSIQIALVDRDALAKHKNLRPLISQICLLVDCQLSDWRQPDAFLPVQQAITADPKQSGTLLVQLSFTNSAQWPQPWPQIELAFTDINGQIIGLRRFRPSEYLNARQAPDIKAGQTVSIEMAIQETSSKADGFNFNFF
jgi:hypothetical protein